MGDVTAEIFADGGVVAVNPSPTGGMWAYVLVDAAGRRIGEQAGTLTPDEAGLPAITNNVTELLAAVRAMQAVPDGWAGVLWTDSRLTMMRVRRDDPEKKLKGVPGWLKRELTAARARLGEYRVELLGGHPTRIELANGRRRDGKPVSVHNVYVDRLCVEQGRLLARRRAGE